MAKQYGIHQIKGKVGQMAYYRQSGVKDSLIRGINQGMSSRVKTGEEYANTRRNNAEFGAACGVAGALGQVVIPKWRPMFLPFSQSKLAKKALELIKLDTTAGSTWGTRSLTAARWPIMLESLNGLSKNPFDKYIIDIAQSVSSASAGRYQDEITLNWASDLASALADYGASGVNLYFAVCSSIGGQYDQNAGAYISAESVVMGLHEEEDAADTSDVTVTFSPRNLLNGIDTLAIVVVPFRDVNGTNFELQEAASFKVFELPEP